MASCAFYLLSRATATCDPASLNTTTSTYTITGNETLSTVSAFTNRGLCDIARANRMADATLTYTNQQLLIPGETCVRDDTTCLIGSLGLNSTNVCVSGGPHEYTTYPGDTLRYVAQKLNISATALNTTSYMLAHQAGLDDVLPEGTSLKAPLCANSTCTITPYQFTHGVYKDLAEEYGVTIGQLMSFNYNYNFSSATPATTGPVIMLAEGCTAQCSGDDCETLS